MSTSVFNTIQWPLPWPGLQVLKTNGLGRCTLSPSAGNTLYRQLDLHDPFFTLSSRGSSKIRIVKVYGAKGRGFGELLKKSKREAEGPGDQARQKACPCGGGEGSKEYGSCCGPFHGGVVEPDALTLMKARFSAYALGVVPYILRTTHPDNPDFEGADKLAEDVRATCARLRFIKLDILDHELGDTEAFVSFAAHYSPVKGERGGERKQLKEKSRFVKEGGRWTFHETLSLSQASKAAWIAATTPTSEKSQYSRKSSAKSKSQVSTQQNATGTKGY